MMDTLYQCNNMTNCEFATFSQDCTNSLFVFYSSGVHDSKSIFKSSNVNQCEHIYQSNFITNSHSIIDSKNITDSNNIVRCTYTNNSTAIIDSTVIMDSHNLRKCRNITNGYFSADCSDSNNILFCSGINATEYSIFNCKINKAMFEQIFNQYKIYSYELHFIDFPATNDIILDSPQVSYAFNRYYQSNKTFDEWVETLPFFSADIMYQITLNPKYLK